MNTFQKYLAKKIASEQETLNENLNKDKEFLRQHLDAYINGLQYAMMHSVSKLIATEINSSSMDQTKFKARWKNYTNLIENAYALLAEMKHKLDTNYLIKNEIEMFNKKSKYYMDALKKI